MRQFGLLSRTRPGGGGKTELGQRSLTKRQVFFDASGARTRWTTRAVVLGYLTLFVLCAIFSATVMDVPRPAPLALSTERPRLRPMQPGSARQFPMANATTDVATALPTPLPSGERRARSIRAAFYAPWDEASGASLTAHVHQLDWLFAGLISVTGRDHRIAVARDPRLDAALARTRGQVSLFPVVRNAEEDDWDGDNAALLLHDPVARSTLLDAVMMAATTRRSAGMVFDFQDLPQESQLDYLRLLDEARDRLASRNMQLLVALSADSSDWRFKAFAGAADKVIVKLYDQHGAATQPGPIAAQHWFADRLSRASAVIGADRVIAAIGNFAYDWRAGADAQPISVEEAWLTAHDSGARVAFDRSAGNPGFAYEEDGRPHVVWLLDAATGWNQLRTAHAYGVAGVALWRLGTEDGGMWTVLRHADAARPPDLARLRSISNVDIEGGGELLRIAAVPTDGARRISASDGGMIVDEAYLRLPTPYVVQRAGNRPGYVALTFDDGPDAEWTPRILDILREKRAPATFFVIGQNALGNRSLLNRIVAEGHELGNHSFTHPNLALVSPEQARLELNVTQRLIQAYTGRSTLMFRAPYFSDAEATTADELAAALLAQNMGYTNVGLHVDPHDWQTQSAESIVDAVLSQVDEEAAGQTRQIVLLHDAGGDRSQTVAALPGIIDGLRQRGRKIVPVSTLAGLDRKDVMPPVVPDELVAVRADIGLFLLLAAIGRVLTWLFYAAILIGVTRAVLMTGLAYLQYSRARRRRKPVADPARLVSVLIPAFNEERVIASSIRQVLRSRDAQIEVIVVDDGSSDSTAAIVRESFADNPAVRLVTIENGGKAKALNHAVGLAKGEVLIALDADTLFAPDTIAKLARWFENPRIGAVAGNVKVGNRINLVTRWQAIEYVTSQNVERRALAALNSIMVVPGAVGAIRRSALAEAGGYPEDTLAEDQDLTIQIQRNGWKVIYDAAAMAWTEAPESFLALAKQRFRWSFGTLQCLWKHRSIYRNFKPPGLALIGLPQTWVLQIGFSLVAPVIDVVLALNIISTAVHVSQHGLARMQGEIGTMLVYWLGFTTLDILCGLAAYRMEPRRERCPVLLLVAQRLVYRQLMYWVIIRAVMAALRGPSVGWGQPRRSGRLGELRRRGLWLPGWLGGQRVGSQ